MTPLPCDAAPYSLREGYANDYTQGARAGLAERSRSQLRGVEANKAVRLIKRLKAAAPFDYAQGARAGWVG